MQVQHAARTNCTSTFETSAAGTLELGLEQAGAAGNAGSYLVDDISIRKQ